MITDDDFEYMSSSNRRSTAKTVRPGSSRKRRGSLRFENPQNRYVEEIRWPRLKTLLFGCLYLAYHGVWGHAFIWVVLCITLSWTIVGPGVVWLLYALGAPAILSRHYAHRGWRPV